MAPAFIKIRAESELHLDQFCCYMLNGIELFNHLSDNVFFAFYFQYNQAIIGTEFVGYFMQTQARFDIAAKVSKDSLNPDGFSGTVIDLDKDYLIDHIFSSPDELCIRYFLFLCFFAQLSLRVLMRLNTILSFVVSGSTEK